jgi:hypothetical protein
MLGYFVAFMLLIAAALFVGNQDQITPTIVHAEADLSIGAEPVQLIEKGISWLLTLVGGAAFTGLVAFVFTEIRKVYQAWKRNSQMKRWAPGPNANYKQTTPSVPRLRREDLMLLALMDRRPGQPNPTSRLGTMRPSSSEDDEFDLEF